MMYNWQHKNWPDFEYNVPELETKLLTYGIKSGQIEGLITGLPMDRKYDAIIDFMVYEALKTSEIEGEYLSHADVYSSIKKNLGLKPSKENITDERAKGIAELIVTLNKTFEKPLSEPMLFNWHATLMKGFRKINSGQWRTHAEPMQVVSGTIGKETVHFEAPPSKNVPNEMKAFIDWFNSTAPNGKNTIGNPLVRSAITHLYFESIHPFEDGNGRIGRFLVEKALYQGMGKPLIISLSKTIEQDKQAYFNALKQAQRTLKITDWINYFTQVIIDAQEDAQKLISFSIKKTAFFDQHRQTLNSRQLKAVSTMLKSGLEGFKGGMTAKKYMSITHTSKATATRDLQELFESGVLLKEAGGRSTHYLLNL
ncbi:Fic family protein [Fulvivirga kasyanovii]|uniref:Fic family protein n=2 Tax=Fulvivirga kasyanovii TaxID=396812 RepID=A0ABW9RT06_9BACT|nr:Fic family protein [Fulvivirga kasyanovii]